MMRGTHAGGPNNLASSRHATTTTTHERATRGNSGWFRIFATRFAALSPTQYWIPNVVSPRIATQSRNPNPSRLMNVPGICCSSGVSMAPSARSHSDVRRFVFVAFRRGLRGSAASGASLIP